MSDEHSYSNDEWFKIVYKHIPRRTEFGMFENPFRIRLIGILKSVLIPLLLSILLVATINSFVAA